MPAFIGFFKYHITHSPNVFRCIGRRTHSGSFTEAFKLFTWGKHTCFQKPIKTFEKSWRLTWSIGSRSNTPLTVSGKLVSSSTFRQSLCNVALRNRDQNSRKSCFSGNSSLAGRLIQPATLITQNTVNARVLRNSALIVSDSSRPIKIENRFRVVVDWRGKKTAHDW